MQHRTTERLARLGYAARGVVYLLVGGLAVLAALGTGGRTTGSQGALQTLLGQPLGWAWLWIVALGLLCFAAWRMLQAVFDADRLGTDRRAMLRRAGFGISAGANAVLAGSTIAWALGLARASGDGEASARDWTAYLLSAPFGRWIVGALGVAVVAAGVAFVVKGLRSRVDAHLALDPTARRWVVPLGRAGHVARGVVFGLIGVFLVMAALTVDARQAHGLAGALRSLQSQPYGWALLALTAAGLFAFGLFQMALARFRRIDAPAGGRLGEAVARGARRMMRAR
ncbi:MAG: DUF1206 domain-containing protein [Rhodovulum sp.]|nr:DUF1206 domain-containing protein [Rhodovulum sp.]